MTSLKPGLALVGEAIIAKLALELRHRGTTLHAVDQVLDAAGQVRERALRLPADPEPAQRPLTALIDEKYPNLTREEFMIDDPLAVRFAALAGPTLAARRDLHPIGPNDVTIARRDGAIIVSVRGEPVCRIDPLLLTPKPFDPASN